LGNTSSLIPLFFDILYTRGKSPGLAFIGVRRANRVLIHKIGDGESPAEAPERQTEH
jgi:hypothetical protein